MHLISHDFIEWVLSRTTCGRLVETEMSILPNFNQAWNMDLSITRGQLALSGCQIWILNIKVKHAGQYLLPIGMCLGTWQICGKPIDRQHFNSIHTGHGNFICRRGTFVMVIPHFVMVMADNSQEFSINSVKIWLTSASEPKKSSSSLCRSLSSSNMISSSDPLPRPCSKLIGSEVWHNYFKNSLSVTCNSLL